MLMHPGRLQGLGEHPSQRVPSAGRLGQSKQPSAATQLPPALPTPYLFSSSFPPFLLSLFQGAAEVGAVAATSLVPTLL